MCVLIAGPALAADVAGKWTAHVLGAQGQGESDITFAFKGDEIEFTRAMAGGAGPGGAATEITATRPR